MRPQLKQVEIKETKNYGAIFIFVALFLAICLCTFVDGDHEKNTLGFVGYCIALGLHYLVGYGSFLIVGFLILCGVYSLTDREWDNPLQKVITFSLFLLSVSIVLNTFSDLGYFQYTWLKDRSFVSQVTEFMPFYKKKLIYYYGGVPTYLLLKEIGKYSLFALLSPYGCLITFSLSAALCAILLFEADLIAILCTIGSCFRWVGSVSLQGYQAIRARTRKKEEDAPFKKVQLRPKLRLPKKEVTEEAPPTPQLRIKRSSSKKQKLPATDLLSQAVIVDKPSLNKKLAQQSEILDSTLKSFGIEAKITNIHCGPTITSFQVLPAVGVKVQKIKALEDDIALNLRAQSIRIIAPIPGKAAVGIEVPSLYPQEVGFKQMLNEYQKSQTDYDIPILLGKSITGEHVSCDLAKMPHCIIAGATGSGKSVCINTIIMSIIMNKSPEEVKLLLIDPKKVELTPFTSLPHLITPVICEPRGAHAALQWIVKEMQYRYEVLKQTGQRNITAFNERTPDEKWEESLDINVPEKFFFLVAVIDEFADLMMTTDLNLETPIARIAQMARAVGIHLILATQRPSREVITGIIKANFPTRIAFKVASRVNSQIILDETGAESLLGNGDMLFLPPGSSQTIRAQGVYIRDADIKNVIDDYQRNYSTNYLLPSFDQTHSDLNDGSYDPKDSLYQKAVELVVQTNNASTTFLQRKLKVGYARAASLVDEMEDQGVIGPAEGAKPRQILISKKSNN